MAQTESNSWMLYRAGRITSSNCKMAFTMNIEKPALSTIKAIMQYNDEINTPATKYGKQFEKVAFNAYNLEMQKQHVNFTASSTGIYVNVKNSETLSLICYVLLRRQIVTLTTFSSTYIQCFCVHISLFTKKTFSFFDLKYILRITSGKIENRPIEGCTSNNKMTTIK